MERKKDARGNTDSSARSTTSRRLSHTLYNDWYCITRLIITTNDTPALRMIEPFRRLSHISHSRIVPDVDPVSWSVGPLGRQFVTHLSTRRSARPVPVILMYSPRRPQELYCSIAYNRGIANISRRVGNPEIQRRSWGSQKSSVISTVRLRFLLKLEQKKFVRPIGDEKRKVPKVKA